VRRPLRFLANVLLAALLDACGAACVSHPLGLLPDVDGVHFRAIRTDCDTIAKDSGVSIIASRDGSRTDTLLLKYDPFDDSIPQILIEGGTIVIHLNRISSILEKSDRWDSFKVIVKADRIDYP
jgi:hypothetical protein